MNTGFGIAIWLLLNLGLVGAYDVWAFFFGHPEDTVSFWVQHWFQAFPVLALAVGIVIGHLAWPIHRQQGGSQ